MKTYQSCAGHYPPEWDLKSSPTTVYHNYDVKEVKHPSMYGEPEVTMYEYTVDQYTRAEYLTVLRELTESENLITMEAVAEIFEMIMGENT